MARGLYAVKRLWDSQHFSLYVISLGIRWDHKACSDCEATASMVMTRD